MTIVYYSHPREGGNLRTMKPQTLKIDPQNIDIELIKQAAEVINNRGLVAFPTETVYGLGANAFDAKAVAGIFEAKKRPLDDPIIVHIAERDMLLDIAEDVPPLAYRLVERFWPGPLTIVLKKKKNIPDIVTTGLDTVGVRMPSNTIAKELIKRSGVPIAAPSANMFSRPSPTTAEHVMDDLAGRIDLILDGGKTEIGIESTVVEVEDKKIYILRPGGISLEEIRNVAVGSEISSGKASEGKSPGEYPRHYSPNAEILLVPCSGDQLPEVLKAMQDAKFHDKKVGILAIQEHEGAFRGVNVKILGPQNNPRVSASRLFSLLREFDAEGTDLIIAESITEKGIGLAVMNRLRKAAGR